MKAFKLLPRSTHPFPHTAPAESLADQLVAYLAHVGVTTYFGVPGGAIEPLFNALARFERDGHIRFVLTRSEAGAGFAADGYYRATGRMAVCTATTGPGTANLLTATMAADADRIPMLLLTPQVALHKQGRGPLQESSMDGHDLPRIFSECTRYSTVVMHPDQLAHKLARALSMAWTAPMGPVHLSIPSDILASRPLTSFPELYGELTPSRAVDLDAVDVLVGDLFRASAPVFYVGDDAGIDAHGLCSVAHVIGATVVSSPAGKRWVGHMDPAYRGVVGFSGHAEAAEAMRKADLIVAFGATFDEFSTNAWSAIPNVPIYSVDRHTAYAYRMPTAKPVIADVGYVLDRIRKQLPKNTASAQLPIPRPPSFVHEVTAGPVHPAELMRWLSHALPSDVVVHVDAGNSFSWSTKYLVRSRPDTYRVAMGLSTMCWAIAAAIGAAIGHQRRTICITGDGAMLMSSLELTVAVEQNLPVTYVVLNDSSLGMVRHGQRLGKAESIAHEMAPVRFDLLAESCGAKGYRVERMADLESIPHECFAGDESGPCVIDVVIDRNTVPPIIDRVAGLASGVSR